MYYLLIKLTYIVLFSWFLKTHSTVVCVRAFTRTQLISYWNSMSLKF